MFKNKRKLILEVSEELNQSNVIDLYKKLQSLKSYLNRDEFKNLLNLIKEYKNNLNISFRDCLKSGLVVSLADSQMLKSIRDITGQQIDRELLEEWYKERDFLKKKKIKS